MKLTHLLAKKEVLIATILRFLRHRLQILGFLGIYLGFHHPYSATKKALESHQIKKNLNKTNLITF